MILNRTKTQTLYQHKESGNIFTLVFAAVAAIAVITVNVTSTLTGPLDTISNLTQISNTDTQVLLSARLAIAESVVGVGQTDNGDSDNDGVVEPPQFVVDATLGLTGGGRVPTNIGISKTDTWGNEIGYCVWDHGAEFNASENRLQGNTNTASDVLAVISAGPDEIFQTSCEPYDGSAPEGVVFVDGSDDIVASFSYAEAAEQVGGQVSELWQLDMALTTASIDSDILVRSTEDTVSAFSTRDLTAGVGVDRRRFSVDGDGSFDDVRTNMVTSSTLGAGSVNFMERVQFDRIDLLPEPALGSADPSKLSPVRVNSGGCSDGQSMSLIWDGDAEVVNISC